MDRFPLSARDRDIVEVINRLRVVSSTQLSRLFFAELREGRSRTTARTRTLRRLVVWRVLYPLERRTGGHAGGSAVQCYVLDSAGQRLIAEWQQAEGAGVRVRRPGPPGERTLRHMLAVSELYVSLVELDRAAGFTVAAWKENGAVLLELAGLGVTLVSATENVNADTAEGELLQGMYAVINGFRSRQDGEDIQRKMTYKASKGGTVHRAPLGYLNVKKRVEGRLISSIIIDEERASLIRLAFELYATGRYSYKALQEKLTEAGLRTRPNGRYGERPVSIYRLGTMLQDRYYLGYVEWDGIEYEGKHESLISQELFDRVQRVLLAERRGGKRERTHNHYLKGVVWCDRCKRRLIIMRGKSKSGELYFYYLCRGRQARLGCDLPYFSVAKIEKAVAAHYATVRLPQDFCERATALMDDAVESKQATALQLRGRSRKNWLSWTSVKTATSISTAKANSPKPN